MHIIKQEKTSFEKSADFLSNMNHGIGYSLCPFSFQGGFSISTSWTLFLLAMFMQDTISCAILGSFWMLSMFFKFR